MSNSVQYLPNQKTLSAIPELVDRLIETIDDLDAPQGFFDFGPYTELSTNSLSPEETQLIAASALIGHRYEQLRISRDLLTSWFSAIESHQVTTSALLSRSMIEFGAESHRDMQLLETCVNNLTASEFLSATKDLLSDFMGDLYRIRYSGRMIDYGVEQLHQQNVLGAIDKLPSWIRQSYDELSEICHPNAQATAIYWSFSKRTRHAFNRVEYVKDMDLAPTPFKIQAAAGPYILAVVLNDQSSFFWKLACCIAQDLSHIRADDRVFSGIPMGAKRNDPCFCGSGDKVKSCKHPSMFRMG